MKYLWIIICVLGIFVGGTLWSKKIAKNNAPENLISENGIHWHPELEIYIKGEKITIPENVGLGGVAHSPIHTHEDLPIIHLEFAGRVLMDDIRLGKFFDVWNVTFNQTRIFDYVNGEEGMVKMFVNEEENTEFENYIMRHEDKIVIRYE